MKSRFGKVYVAQPFMVPRIREELKGRWTILSGDIPFVNRFFLDGDFPCMFQLMEKGDSEHPVDVCLEVRMDDVSHCDPFPAPFKIFSFDLETSIAHDTILCAAAVIEDMGTGERTHHTFAEDEETILKKMTQLMRESDPDIITGYNIDNFDMGRIVDRANLLAKSNKSLRPELMGWGRVSVTEEEAEEEIH